MRSYACALVLIASCGADNGDDTTNNDVKLDCAWLEGDNCWKQGVQQARDCVDPSIVGTLSLDRLSCTFGGGTIVTFDDAVPSDNASAYVLNFTLAISNDDCVRFQAADVRLETDQGAVVAASDGSSYNVSCPGDPVLTGDLQLLSDCAVGHLPGFSWNADPGFFEVFLAGGTSGAADLLFECQP